MDNPEIMYNSAGMPVGTRSVSIYRQNTPGLVNGQPGAPAFGNGGTIAGCTLLGIYNLEMFSWKSAGKEIERNKPSGADLDFAIVRQKITGSATAQLATGKTPLLREGLDMFEISPGYEADGVTPLPLQRFVVISADKDETEGAANKQSIGLRFDRNNSDAFWQS
jgi:hypothetical protein